MISAKDWIVQNFTLPIEDAVELNTVRQSLMTVIRLDSRSALTMIFQGAMKTAEVRDKTIEFLVADFLPYRDEFFSKNPALEKQFSEELVKALDDVTGSAYTSLMSILTALRMYDRTQAKNRSELVASLVKSLPENHFNVSYVNVVSSGSLPMSLTEGSSAVLVLQRRGRPKSYCTF